MGKKWTHWKHQIIIIKFVLILYCSYLVEAKGSLLDENVFDSELKNYVDSVFSTDNVDVVPGVRFEKVAQNDTLNVNEEGARKSYDVGDYFKKRLGEFTNSHVVSVNVGQTARFLSSAGDSGKSSFLAGFGMGFLVFALKKLLLPVFIGAQLIKSVVIAMFLPTLLGGLGKIVGKGLSTFSGISGASNGLNQNHDQNQLEEFEFKDVNPYANQPGQGNDFNAEADATNQLANVDTDTSTTSTNSRFGLINQRIYAPQPPSDNYYMRRPPTRKTDYKVFHKIPSSSMLLTSYDPFYSPLLSRLDSIFQQLGLGNDKSPETERCRERLVCLMYANPAKYAPYSNLVSAQLSRELNELKKPSSDNPEILRFFRYMKAAKDGQDGGECHAHGGCKSLTSQQPSPAMLTTFNDINKLVLARKFQ